MARLRTFIALDLGKALRDRCLALQDALARDGARLKWVEEENIHLTLLFLGEVEDRELPALCKAVADCCAERNVFTLSAESLGCFPHSRRPRIVWAGVGAGTAEVCDLHDALETPLLRLGCYRREARPYTPHITLGRLEGDRAPEKLAATLARHAKWRGGETTIREVCVFSSELRSEGPVYSVLSRAKLRTSPN